MTTDDDILARMKKERLAKQAEWDAEKGRHHITWHAHRGEKRIALYVDGVAYPLDFLTFWKLICDGNDIAQWAVLEREKME